MNLATTALVVSVLLAAVATYLFYKVSRLRAELAEHDIDLVRNAVADRERDRVFDLALDMMLAVDFDGGVLVANPQFQRTLGWSDAELRAMRFLEFVHPDDHAAVNQELERLRRGEATTNFQNRLLCKDGSYKMLSWRAAPDTERGVIYCVARDVTDDEELFRTFVENSTQVVWMNDPATGRMVYVSPAYETIWGRTCASLYDNPHSWVEAVHPEDRPRVEEAFENQASTAASAGDYRIVRPDGTIRWIRDRAFPIFTAGGRMTRVAGIAADVTEQRETELHLIRRERLASIGTLAAGIAHEINNPLGAILLATQSAMKHTQDPKRIERALLDVAEEAQRCGRIVDSVLTFAREETLEKQSADLNALVARSAQLFARHAEQRGAIVGLELAEDLPPLTLNETEIEQVLLNLLENACDAGASQVSVRTEELDGYVGLSIEDDGAGIAEDDLPHIFEPFYTTRRERGGSGLGLSITHGILSDHNAEISILPGKPRGTRVAIRFPTAEQPAHKEYANG